MVHDEIEVKDGETSEKKGIRIVDHSNYLYDIYYHLMRIEICKFASGKQKCK